MFVLSTIKQIANVTYICLELIPLLYAYIKNKIKDTSSIVGFLLKVIIFKYIKMLKIHVGLKQL